MTEHKYAAKLLAIAKGEQMQKLRFSDHIDICPEDALAMLAGGLGHELRIKPEPRVVYSHHNYLIQHEGVYTYSIEHTIHDDGTVEVRVVK